MIKIHKKMKQNTKYNKIKEIKLIPKTNPWFLKSSRVLGHTLHPNLTKKKNKK